MTLSRTMLSALVVLGLSGSAALAENSACHGEAQQAAYTQKKDIVSTAQSAGQFQTLLAAAQAAGLADALKGEGPLTVFAPTDEAFAKLPAGTVENLLKPENREKLVAILSYHVVPAKATAKDVAGMSEVATLSGKTLSISTHEGKVKVGQAQVVQADVMASNGVIHVIDTVLIPAD